MSGVRDVLRQRHDGDAPAARHDRDRLRRRRLHRAGDQRLRTGGQRRTGRIVDLYTPDFFAICGCPSWSGTTQVTVSVY